MSGVTNLELIDASGRGPTEQRNAALVREIFTHFSRADFAFFWAKVAERGDVSVIGLTPERLGRHASNPNLIPELFANGMDFTIKRVAIDGDMVIVEWEDVAEASTGKRYENTGLSLFVFNDGGKIVTYHEYFDPEKFIGVLP